MMELEPDQKLPALREDLRLFQGARDWDGQPNWTVFDPLRNRYFQFGERQFMLLSHWGEGTPAAIRKSLEREGLEVQFAEIGELAEFLVIQQLIEAPSPAMRERLAALSRAGDKSLWQRVLHGYLFFRFPLVRPDHWLERLYPLVRFLFTRTFLRVTLLVGILGLVMIVQRWDEFINTLPWFFSAEGMLVFALTLVAVKVLHELGHALTCKHYELRVPTMGIAFLVMWPVLYTDASDAWRLRRRRQRAFIDAAGVTVELLLACYAMLLWAVLPEGLARSVAFTVATTTWVLSLVVNLNPFMRFDGYYFLSDILNVPNLQERSFELGRWRLRKWIFGGDAPPPERFPHGLQRGLTAYAFGVWVYRFFLFLGIALLVYHFFFKALGIFLFAVEIWWFILRPIMNEVKRWKAWVPGMSNRRRTILLVAGLVALVVLVFPWRQEVTVPAEWSQAQLTRIFPIKSGRVEQLLVNDGDTVAAGQPLLRMSSPALEHELLLARLEVERLDNAIAENAASSEKQFSERLVLEQQLERARSSLAALERAREQLVIKAPHGGTVRGQDTELHEGRWIPTNKRLMTVVGTDGPRVLAWVTEKEVGGISAGSDAYFYAANHFGPIDWPVRLTRVESSALGELDNPYHASSFGGDLPVREDRSQRLVPEIALYRVHGVPQEGMPEPGMRIRGWVRLETGRSSYLGRLGRWLTSVVIRETGF